MLDVVIILAAILKSPSLIT